MKICWDNLDKITFTKLGNFRTGKKMLKYVTACKVCGEPFLAKTYNKGIYCSNKCSACDKKNAETKCRQCNRYFHTNRRFLFCSKSCAIKHRMCLPEVKKIYSKRMSGVNNPFYGKQHSKESLRKMSEVKKEYHKNNPDNQKGDRNPLWKGGSWLENERNILKKKPRYINWRKAVFGRDDFTCRRCDQVGGELNAHHIYPWKDFPLLRYEIWNGFTLCIHCHRYVHSKNNKNNDYLKVA